nr:MBG domain-containing protein [Clostridium sp. Marseille-P7770]
MNNVNLSGIKISSTEQSAIDHYELITDKLTLSGEITKATLNSNSEVKAKAPLLYTGTSLRPEVVYDIKGIAGDSGKGIPAERSTNAENDGTTANLIDGLEILYKVNGAEDSTYSTEVPLFKEIGTHKVDYKVTSTNYEDLTGTFDVQIQKMNLVDAYVGFKKSSLVYTGSALDPGMTVKGSETSEDIVSGENYTVKYQRVQDVSGNTVTEEAVTAPTEAGTYNVIITAKQESTFVEGAKTVEKGVTVLPKALSDTQGKPTVSISMTPESFTYDTKVHQVKDGNIVVTDTDRNVTLTQGTDYEITPPSEPIQTAKAYIFSFTGKGNYTGSCTKEIEVRKADLTNAKVEINGTYTYSGEAQEPGNGDTTQVQVTLDHIPVNSSEYTLEYANNTVAAEASSNAAPTVTVKAIDDGNYQGTVSKTFTILRKPLMVTAENKQVTYKEDAPEFTAVYDGFVGEETLAGVGGTISFLCKYENGSPVGDYEIQPEVTGLANYEVTANKGTLSVQPRTPVLTDSANLYTTRIYDGKAVDLAPTTDGDGEMSSVITNRETNEVLTSDPVDVGKYHVVYSFDAGTNYSAGSVAYDFDITPAPLKITAADQKLSYLDEIPEHTADYDGFVNGENLESAGGTVRFDCSYQKGTAVGSYPINPEVTGLKNYEVTTESGTMTVEKRTPVFTDSANLYTTRVYDGKAVDLTPATDGDGTVSRVITNRETNEVLTSDPVDVGEYRVVYSVSEGKNYAEGSVSYDFAITQAPLVITAEDKNVVFGAKAPEYTVVYDGFVNGETEAVLTGTLVVTCDYTVESREYTYEIVPSGLSAKNYAITWKNGVLTARYPESDNDDYEETSKPANSKMPKSGTNNPGQEATAKDAKKGYVNENSGIVSGKTLTEEMLKNDNGSLNDGYSHWIQTNAGWWFRYADGSYPKAAGAVNSGSGNSSAAQSYEWVQIDGNWWSFDSNGYLGTGWIVDPVYRNWFYVDANTGMKTGWVQIDGKWYYFNPVSDGTKGIMFANRMTPDGWFVREDGSWDEKR